MTASPEAHASTRHRGDSSLPVGNSSTRNRKPPKTATACVRPDNHAATAPPGKVGPFGDSAAVAYWPKKNWAPKATEAARKIQPMAFPGRRETTSAPRIAKVGVMIVAVTQFS